MAYRQISDSEVEVRAPITSALLFALRDNLLAVLLGDSTSPSLPIAGSGDFYIDVTADRLEGTNYQNTTQRSIAISVLVSSSSTNASVVPSSDLQVSQDGVSWITVASQSGQVGGSTGNFIANYTAIVGAGEYYRVRDTPASNSATAINRWVERRA